MGDQDSSYLCYFRGTVTVADAVPVFPAESVACTSIGVARKPWITGSSLLRNLPTISPKLLIPWAWVVVAPGTSMVVKVGPSFRKPWDPVASLDTFNIYYEA